MQMLFTKHLLHIIALITGCIIFAPATSLAETSFADQFLIEPTIDTDLANRITSYSSENISLSLEQRKTELNNINNKLESIQGSHESDPVYWFIYGLHQKNIASLYNEAGDKNLTERHLDNKNSAYKKSMDLDTKKKKLSAQIFSTMKHGLPQDLKITATQKELSLGGSGDSESHYWYLHWSNVDQLQKAGREKEAAKALKNMQREMKQRDVDMSIYGSLSKQVESSVKPPEPPKAKKPPKENKPEPSTKAASDDKPMDRKYVIISVLVAVSGLSLIIVTVYELMLKNRKRKK